MNARTLQNAYGTLTEPATLTVQRRLPGPIERVWAYLTESDLRRQWLAAGDMPMEIGATVELVWRNDELTDPPGQRPEGFPSEHRMSCRITELDPPHRLAITWGSTGGVSFVLAEDGNEVLLTVTHRRVAERSTLLNVSTGWHMHLDVLVARLTEQQPTAFWDRWVDLKHEYEQRMPV